MTHMARCILAAFVIVGSTRLSEDQIKTTIDEFGLLKMSEVELVAVIKKYKLLNGNAIQQQFRLTGLHGSEEI